MNVDLEGRMTKGMSVAVEEGQALSPAEQTDSLLRLALEQKVPVDVLERLVDLQRAISEENARKAMTQALAKFQAAVAGISKNKEARISTRSGRTYGYTYASLDHTADEIRAPLSENGLSYTWDSELTGGQLKCICVVRHILGAEQRATFSCPTDTKAEMSGAQATGAALTYARRQSLIQALGLTVADDDTDAAEPTDITPITDGQAADLIALADEVRADKLRFLAFIGVEKFADIPAARYEEAVAALESKRNAPKAK